ncbi:TIGR01777 family oxidoreductase [Aestuariibacter halophilus]|uniref:TIGR01777 family oxidoreductase n=1 Tax=Fluctibacter halophilus TaxID=226011 RepID=A0ABS8G3Z7_9ALTE|nr:TIGR01777 family oxidoreductase [Aestuariibacter halophilus]MCC2615250.1 TIGR01777 family oxidoreductase [Aestuariibacter halophilus]
MHILITGGTGLIGSRLIPQLFSDHKLSVITRNVAMAENVLSHKVALHSSLDKFSNLDEFDAVINLAGEPIVDRRWSEEQKQRICDSRWNITERLVQLCNAGSNPPAVFISGSAIGIYGRQDDRVIDEDFSDYHDEFSHTVCQRWEDIALQAKSPQTRVCILRTGIVLSAQGGALAKMLTPFKLGLGGPIGDGQQFMSWIHIRDMIDGIVFLLNEQKCEGVYNLTAPEPVTNEAFVRSLAAHLHRPCVMRAPAFALKAMLGERADLVLYGQRVIPKRLQDAGFTFSFPTLAEAMDNLSERF